MENSLSTRFVDVLGRIAYALFRLFGWKFVTLTGALVGDFVYYFNKKKRDRARREIAKLFGDAFESRRLIYITKRSFLNHYMRQVETLYFGALTKKKIDQIMQVEGLENLNKAMSKGRGVVLLLSHFGSFLLPLPYLGYRGYRINQVTGIQRHGSRFSEKVWEWRRREASKLPVKFIQVGKILRPMYEVLGKNEILAIAFDGRDGSKWVPVKFFAGKALFSSGVFELARRTGAVIIPTFVVRDGRNCHKLILEQPFRLSNEADGKRGATIDTKNFARIFAEYVNKYPCHFGMVLCQLKEAELKGESTPFFVEE